MTAAASLPVLSRRRLRAERDWKFTARKTDRLNFVAPAYPMSRDTHPFTRVL